MFHVLAGAQRLKAQSQQRLGVRRANVEVPVVVIDGEPIEPVLPGAGEALGEFLELRVLVADLGVDLAGDEVPRAVAIEQLRHARVAGAQQLQDQQRRVRAGVGAVEIMKVVMARHLAAEDRVSLGAHARFEEGMADAVDKRGSALL